MLRQDEPGHAGRNQDMLGCTRMYPFKKWREQHVQVYASIYWDILGYTIILVDKTVYTCIYEYILVYTRTEPEMSYDVI